MTALIVTGAVLAVILFLLISSVAAEISFRDGEWDFSLRYLFYRYALFDQTAEEKTVKKAKKDAEEGRKVKAEGEGEPKSGKDTVKMVMVLARSSRRGLSILRRHLVFSRVQIYISVGGSDAAETARLHAQTGAAVQAALDMIRTVFVLKKPKVAVAPDFLRGYTRSDIRLRVGIRFIFVLAAAAGTLWRFLRVSRQNDKESDQTNQIKGGKTA